MARDVIQAQLMDTPERAKVDTEVCAHCSCPCLKGHSYCLACYNDRERQIKELQAENLRLKQDILDAYKDAQRLCDFVRNAASKNVMPVDGGKP